MRTILNISQWFQHLKLDTRSESILAHCTGMQQITSALILACRFRGARIADQDLQNTVTWICGWMADLSNMKSCGHRCDS